MSSPDGPPAVDAGPATEGWPYDADRDDPTEADVAVARQSAYWVSDASMEAVALIDRGQRRDAVARLAEAALRADNARAKLSPSVPRPGLADRYLTILVRRCAVFSPRKFPEVVAELLQARDAELDVLSDSDTRHARQVAAVQRVIDEQKAYCSANRVDAPPWVETIQKALDGPS